MKKLLISTLILALGAGLALAQAVNASGRKLNPQPLPPGKKATTTGVSKVALNPQPLPPGMKRALNPQPLPPGMKAAAGKPKLNPQPLPPGKTATDTSSPK